MKERKSDNQKYYIFSVILGIVVCIVYMGAIYTYPIQNVDEFSSLATPIILTGGDWSDIIGNTRWHGWGVAILLSPLCRLLSDGVLIYRCSLVLCLLIRVALTLLTYRSIVRFTETEPRAAFVISLLCSVGIMEPSDGRLLSNMTEIPITLLYVIWLYLLQSIIEEPCDTIKKKTASFLLPIVIIYGFSLHSRVVVMILALLLSVLPNLNRLIKTINFRAMLIGGIVGAKIYLLVNQCVNEMVYHGASGGMNTASYVVTSQTPKVTRYLMDIQIMVKVLSIVASNFASYTLYSFGFFSFAVVAVISIIFRAFRDKKYDYIFVCTMFSALSWVGINVGIAIQNVNACYSGKYAWLTYLRYSLPFMWGIIVGGGLYYYKEGITARTLCVAEGISCVSLIFMKMYTVQIIGKSGYDLTNTIFRRLFYNDEPIDIYFSKMLMLCVFIQVITVGMVIKKKSFYLGLLYVVPSIINTGQLELTNLQVSNTQEEIFDTIAYYHEKSDYDLMYAGSERFSYAVRLVFKDDDITYCDDIQKLDEKSILVTDEISQDIYQEYYVKKITDIYGVVSIQKLD